MATGTRIKIRRSDWLKNSGHVTWFGFCIKDGLPSASSASIVVIKTEAKSPEQEIKDRAARLFNDPAPEIRKLNEMELVDMAQTTNKKAVHGDIVEPKRLDGSLKT